MKMKMIIRKVLLTGRSSPFKTSCCVNKSKQSISVQLSFTMLRDCIKTNTEMVNIQQLERLQKNLNLLIKRI